MPPLKHDDHLPLPHQSRSAYDFWSVIPTSNKPLSMLPTASPPRKSPRNLWEKYAPDPGRTSYSAAGYILVKRLCIATFLLLGVFCWWRSGGLKELGDLKQAANSLSRAFLLPPELDRSHFIPASNQYFHVSGRSAWMSITADNLSQILLEVSADTFLHSADSPSGAYVEFVVHNSSSLYVSLHNTAIANRALGALRLAEELPEVSALDFHSRSGRLTASTSLPATLVTQVDGRYTNFFLSATGVLSIAAVELDASEDHMIRITNLGSDTEKQGPLEFEGIWINDEGSLISSQQMMARVSRLPVNASVQIPSSNLQRNGLPHRKNVQWDSFQLGAPRSSSKKTLEIVSDMTLAPRTPSDVMNSAASVGWENLVGEMFGIDQVHVALDGMCLVTPCYIGRAQPTSIKDAFFRSGPPGTTSFARSWNFHAYVPDAMLLILGSSDQQSWRKHKEEYEMSARDFRRNFEDGYIKFVRAIRQAAYPLHPAALDDYSSNADGFVFNSAPATIPIFIVTPFTGEMSYSSRTVVEKLQADGDKSVFWLDTSGWFAAQDFESSIADGSSLDNKLLLNTRGNQKAAMFLHTHLCHHLASEQAHCAFLKHEAYTGKAYVPRDAEMEKAMEQSKIEKLKSSFWPKIEASAL